MRRLALDTPYLADVVLHLPTLQNVVALDIDSASGTTTQLVSSGRTRSGLVGSGS